MYASTGPVLFAANIKKPIKIPPIITSGIEIMRSTILNNLIKRVKLLALIRLF
jgi:hypothetical protein